MNTTPLAGKRIAAVKHRRVHCPKTNEEIEVWVSMTLDDGTVLYPSVEELEDGYATILNSALFKGPPARAVPGKKGGCHD